MNVVRRADDARASRSPEGSARISLRKSLMVAPAAERAASGAGLSRVAPGAEGSPKMSKTTPCKLQPNI